MKKTVVSLVLVMLFTTVSLASFAGSSNGIFVNPQVTSASQVYSGVGTNQFTTGTPYYCCDRPTKLTFTGKSFGYGLNDITEGKAFRLGRLSYYNGYAVAGTSVNAISLDITTTFANPIAMTGNSELDFNLNFRPSCQRDTLKLDSEDLTFSISDCYSIEILGFNSCGTEVEMAVNEWSCKSSCIWARVTRSCPVVPAPSAVLLGSFGMGIIGWLRKRNA